MIKTRRQALAIYFSMDSVELEEYRYQSTRTNIPVYAFDNAYYCITKGKEKPATHRDGFDWNWRQVYDSFVNSEGWIIWISTN